MAAESSEQPPEHGSNTAKKDTHERASPEPVNSVVQDGTLERRPTSCHTPRDHCTSLAKNMWQAHAILTSTKSSGTSCTIPVTTIRAELELPQEAIQNNAIRAKAKANIGFNTKTPNHGFRRMFRLTLVQVGLGSIEEFADLSSAQKTSSKTIRSPTHQHTLSEHSESLTPQPTIVSPCPSSSAPYQERQPPNHELQPSQLLPSNDAIPTPNPLKRKVTGKEFDFLTKRLRSATRGLEPIFFDPVTATLIPQLSLEYFITKDSQIAEDEAHNCKSFYHNLFEICSQTNANSNTAEEAGLIMSPPSP